MQKQDDLKWAIYQVSRIVSPAQIQRHYFQMPDAALHLQSIMLANNAGLSELPTMRDRWPEPSIEDLEWAINELRLLCTREQIKVAFVISDGERLLEILFPEWQHLWMPQNLIGRSELTSRSSR